jgi:predicted O-methyltransferase YrrM
MEHPQCYSRQSRRFKLSIQRIPVENLDELLGFGGAKGSVEPRKDRELTALTMVEDDAPILRYFFRNFRPKRHLEFGTWDGKGTLCCLEECDATVWTINLPEGEGKHTDEWAYPIGVRVSRWQARTLRVLKKLESMWLPPPLQGIHWRVLGQTVTAKSDVAGNIGRAYLEKELGSRVCQIYCDSTRWVTSAYPDGFFDSVLVDGGHTRDVVLSDTHKALRLLRKGGIIFWHDYCPDQNVRSSCSSTRGVYQAIEEMLPWLESQTSRLAWLDPSWLLIGVKK